MGSKVDRLVAKERWAAKETDGRLKRGGWLRRQMGG
jgi:hypothetical protein